MSKRERTVTRVLERTPAHLIEPHPSREQVLQWVSGRMSSLVTSPRAGAQIHSAARKLLARSRGVVVSSTMALSTAIVAMRSDGDPDSVDLALLQAVLRYSEEHQVPPRVVMDLLATKEEESPSALS